MTIKKKLKKKKKNFNFTQLYVSFDHDEYQQVLERFTSVEGK